MGKTATLLIARIAKRTTHAWIMSDQGRTLLVEPALLETWAAAHGFTLTMMREATYTFYVMHTDPLPDNFSIPAWAWRGGWYGS